MFVFRCCQFTFSIFQNFWHDFSIDFPIKLNWMLVIYCWSYNSITFVKISSSDICGILYRHSSLLFTLCVYGQWRFTQFSFLNHYDWRKTSFSQPGECMYKHLHCVCAFWMRVRYRNLHFIKILWNDLISCDVKDGLSILNLKLADIV